MAANGGAGGSPHITAVTGPDTELGAGGRFTFAENKRVTTAPGAGAGLTSTIARRARARATLWGVVLPQ